MISVRLDVHLHRESIALTRCLRDAKRRNRMNHQCSTCAVGPGQARPSNRHIIRGCGPTGSAAEKPTPPQPRLVVA
jgi:hypothetical protein